MNTKAIRCEICGRQIISNSDENTDYTIGHNYGNGQCLMLVKGVACPECTVYELKWSEMTEGVGYE